METTPPPAAPPPLTPEDRNTFSTPGKYGQILRRTPEADRRKRKVLCLYKGRKGFGPIGHGV